LVNLGEDLIFHKLKTKNVVCGLGEIGKPILQLISKHNFVVGFDINEKLMNKKQFDQNKNIKTLSLHICIPFTQKFTRNVRLLYKKFQPELIVIHSTISPGTTNKLQTQLPIPIIYSATRGVHKRMLSDLKKYTKFFAIENNAPRAKWAISTYSKLMKKCGVKTKKMKNPLTLELAKIIVDTSYYGWLINYAQLSNMIAIKNKIDYDEMWSFADEIHKYLGNRPKMFPGFIGGHCLDGNEILFIKTKIGMQPITIREYVEDDYQNDVLSYDPIKKKPIFDKVTTKWKRLFSGNMVSLTARTNRSITTTDEHVMIASNSLSEMLAKDIRVNDDIPFIAELPKMNTKQSFDFELTNWRFRYNMPKSISVTPEFCRLLGYYISEGSVSNYGKGYSTRFSFNKNETEYISDVCKILESLGFNYYKTTQKNVTHIGVKSTPFSLFISDTLGCGRESNSKCLPEFIYFVPRELKEQFVRGYFRGDGSFMPSLGLVQAGTVSRMLAAGLDLLLLSMGYVMTLTSGIHSPSVIEGRTISGKTLYALVSKKQVQCNKLASISGFVESQIQRQHSKNLWHMLNENLYMIKTSKTIHEEKDQDVYSIDTENHLFVSTGGRLIHNCVIPNLDLINEDSLFQIDKINNMYARKVKNSKLIQLKYDKSKKTSYDFKILKKRKNKSKSS